MPLRQTETNDDTKNGVQISEQTLFIKENCIWNIVRWETNWFNIDV